MSVLLSVALVIVVVVNADFDNVGSWKILRGLVAGIAPPNDTTRYLLAGYDGRTVTKIAHVREGELCLCVVVILKGAEKFSNNNSNNSTRGRRK